MTRSYLRGHFALLRVYLAVAERFAGDEVRMIRAEMSDVRVIFESRESHEDWHIGVASTWGVTGVAFLFLGLIGALLVDVSGAKGAGIVVLDAGIALLTFFMVGGLAVVLRMHATRRSIPNPATASGGPEAVAQLLATLVVLFAMFRG